MTDTTTLESVPDLPSQLAVKVMHEIGSNDPDLYGRIQEMLNAVLAAAPQPAPDQAEDESRVCLHCGVQTRARFDPCWRCGLWHSRLVADGYKRLQARVDRSAPQPATPGERMIRAAEEAVAIARGEAEPASVYPAPQPAAVDREALVRLLQIITRNGSLDDGRTLHEVIADALLARGLRLSGGDETMAWAVIGEDGTVNPWSVREDREFAEAWAEPGDSIKRVAIRVVEGGDDAA